MIIQWTNYMKFCLILFFGLFSRYANAQQYTIENNEVKLNTSVRFATASSVLLPESVAALEIIKKFMEDKNYITLLRVEGHTSSNEQQLSEQRAAAVCKKLAEMGVTCKRLLPVGFGNTKPVADNSTPEGKAANTRINFIIAAIRDRAIGGMPVDGGGKVAADTCNQ